MKKLIALLALVAASGMAIAQTGNAPQQPPAGTQAPSTATPATPGPQATPPAPTGKHQPQAKSQEEFKAYNDAMAKPDPPSMEQAANAFAQQYATSELRAPAYQNVMIQYQNANNSDKTIEMGRKTLSLDPDNPVALATVAQVISIRTRVSDMDKEERLNEAIKDANRAIELMNSGEGIPAGAPADKAEAYKNMILSTAYAALGQSNFVNTNYPAAETALKKSVDVPGLQPDPITWFQYALTLDRENKFAEAQAAAEKCVQISAGHPVNQFCVQELKRAKEAAVNPAAKPAAK